jgi:outer membrane protein
MSKSIWISVLALGVALASLALPIFNKPKTGFVQLGLLYEGFSMKKDYEQRFEKVAANRKSILDSMEFNLRNLSSRIEQMSESNPERKASIQEFEIKKQAFLMKQKAFTEDNQRASQQYQDEIWKQVNQYVNDYGKENEFAYIFGAEGSGSIMYGNSRHDITEQLKVYINEKYRGN